jgi:signal transduction histidine kinase
LIDEPGVVHEGPDVHRQLMRTNEGLEKTVDERTARLGNSGTVAMMGRALGGLNGLMTAILDISRLDAGVIEPAIEIVDIGVLLARLAVEYRAKAASEGLELRVIARDFCVRTDKALFERAVRNLIENALRYAQQRGVLVGMRRRGDQVRIDVVDTGIGTAEEKQTEIFDEFHQFDNPRRDLVQGLGLGLAIVARLAAILGMKIDVASRPGRGSRCKTACKTFQILEWAPRSGQKSDR